MSACLTFPRESIDSYQCTILVDADPTGWSAELALAAVGDRPTTWVAGSLIDIADRGDGTWEATFVTPLIGPGQTLDPGPGTWNAFLRLDPPGAREPVLYVGQVVVT